MSIPTTRPLGAAHGTGETGGPDGTTGEEISRFVQAVRAQLDDLSADEVTELTGGLEADLTDALAEEGGTPAEHYGDPVAYAGELRAAAGLPPRAAGGARRGVGAQAGGDRSPFGSGPVGRSPRQIYDHWVNRLNDEPWWPTVRDFLIVLRPAWWALRAWVAVQVLMQGLAGNSRGVIPGGVPGFVLLIVAVVISVQLGRHSPFPQPWARRLILVGNVIAVIALLPVASDSGSSSSYYSDSGYNPPTGLSNNGDQVSNVFPYDSQGRPLTGVQLYDQDGHQLEIGDGARSYSNDANGTYGDLSPASGPGTPPRWNVFPLQVRMQNRNGGLAAPTSAPIPFAAVPPLVAVPTPAATTSASATASSSAAAASPGATAAARATPTSGEKVKAAKKAKK